MNQLSISDAVRYGWQTTRENFGFLALMTLIVNLAPLVPQGIGLYAGEGSVMGIVLWLVALILSLGLTLGGIRIILNIVDGKPASYDLLYSCFHLGPPYLIAGILYLLAVVAGLFALVIPGLILGVTFGFFEMFIVDEELGPIAALAASAKLTAGARWDVAKLFCAMGGLFLLGALLLGIGLIVTLPVAYLAFAYSFRKLQSGE